MSTSVGSIHYDLNLKTDSFDRASAGISDRLNNIGHRMQSVGKTMTATLTLPIVAGFGFAIKSASDFQETLNKVDVSFKDQSNRVKEWAKTSITAMGLARGTALDMAALFGDMATGMGFTTSQAADMSTNMVQLAADMASFKNVSFDVAKTALAGVFTGETESLKQLGIIMTETNVKAYALANGFKDNWEQASQTEKVMWRYKFILDQTKNAQGDFARTSNSTSNQIRQTKERFKELSTEVGEKMLPHVNKLLEKLSGLLDAFSKLSPKTQSMVLIFLGIVAILGPVIFIIGTLITAITAIGTVVAAVAAFVGVSVGVLLAIFAVLALAAYFIVSSWNTLKQWFLTFWQFLQQMWDSITQKVVSTWHSIYSIVTTILAAIWAFISPILNFIKNLFTIVFGGILLVVIYTLQAIWGVVSSVFTSVWSFISNIWNSIYTIITGIVRSILNFFAPAFSWLLGRGQDIVRGLAHGISSMASALWNAIAGVAGQIGRFFAGASGWLWDAGTAIIRGLLNGISSLAGAVYQKAEEIANGIKNRIKSALSIQSPSKVFYGFGENIVQGLVQGIAKNREAALGAMNSILPATTVNAGATAPVSPTTNQNINMTINLEGIMARSRGDLREIGRDLMEAINEEMRAKPLKGHI